MSDEKQALIKDIEMLLNRFGDAAPTTINPQLLAFMDDETLRQIIMSLLEMQEKTVESNLEWLEQFKKH